MALIDVREYYDHFSKTYETHRVGGYHRFIDDLETELVLPWAGGSDVLEIGCGTGLILEKTAIVARTHVGIDISEGMLKVAKERGLETCVASVTKLPFEDESFDLSYSFKVLSHVPELEVAIREMSRVTRVGGRVFVELYNRHSLRYLARIVRGGVSIGEGIDDNQVYFRFHSPSEMIRALPASLQLVRWHGVRLFTAIPSSISWPVVGPILQRAERRCRSSALARFGGFLVMECVRI